MARDEERLTRRDLNHRFDEIVDFEQQITDDGYVLVKFFFHISKKEQKKRRKLLDDQKPTRWRVKKAEWDHNRRHGENLEIFQ